MDAIQAAIAKARAARTAALSGEAAPRPDPGPSAPDGVPGPQPLAQPSSAPGEASAPAPPAPVSGAAPGVEGPAASVPPAPASTPAPAPPARPDIAAAAPSAASPSAAAASAPAEPARPAASGLDPAGPGPDGPNPAALDLDRQRPTPAAAAAQEAAPPAPGQLRQRWQALPEFTPQPRLLARNHIVTATGGRESAPFDQMRTRLLQQMRANGWRRVAITSPGPGCGKSTIALNLALSLARQAEQRTVLAELDLRRPSLARLLGLRQPQDLVRVLEGRDPFAAQAARIGANLAFSTCRGPTRNSAELMHSPAAAEALQRIEADYAPTIFLFDTPPVLLVDDAMAVMGQMDCALIVAAAEATRIAEIDRCERELASQTNVLGVVLNKCRYMGQGYDYGYYGS